MKADTLGEVPTNPLAINRVSRPHSGRFVGQPEVGRCCVNKHPIQLGHESLDVTLADLKGKDAESKEAQEHANSSSLALYA